MVEIVINENEVIYRQGSNPGNLARLSGSPEIWYVKEGERKNSVTSEGKPEEYSRSIGAILEVYAASLYKLFSNDDNIVNTLIRTEDINGLDKYKIASKIIEGFVGVEESIANGRKIEVSSEGFPSLDGKSIKGLNQTIAIRTLIGDPDFANMQNIGYIDHKEFIEIGSIDFGKAFKKPEIAYFLSSKHEVNSFEALTNPIMPTRLFLYRDGLEGLTDEKRNHLASLFKDQHLEGLDRVQPGIIPELETIIFPFPEAMNSKKELDETFKYIIEIPAEKIKELTDTYEGMISDYISRNNIAVEFNKGQLIAPVLERIELVREYFKEQAGPDIRSAILTADPEAIISQFPVDRAKRGRA